MTLAELGGMLLALVVVVALGAPVLVERLRRLADERRRRGMSIVERLPLPAPPEPLPQPVTDREWREISLAVDGPPSPPRSGTGGAAARKVRRAADKKRERLLRKQVRAVMRAA